MKKKMRVMMSLRTMTQNIPLAVLRKKKMRLGGMVHSSLRLPSCPRFRSTLMTSIFVYVMSNIDALFTFNLVYYA